MQSNDDSLSLQASKIEVAKGLKSIKNITPESYFEQVKKLIVPPDAQAEIDRAIKGLAEEDEFALMCRLMGTATHLVPLEQRPIVNSDCKVPDFLAIFKPGFFRAGFTENDSAGFRCLVEVKSTEKDRLKFGGTSLKLLRGFAREFHLPLLFAVRFLRYKNNALWVIVEDEDTDLSSVSVSYADLKDGIRYVLWDEYLYILPAGIYFRESFEDTVSGIRHHAEHGTLKEFRFTIGNQTVVLNQDNIAFTYSLFFHTFNLEEVHAEREGSVTHRILKPQLMICSLLDMIYSFNQLPKDEYGRQTYDASKILAQLDYEHNRTLIDRRFIEEIADELLKKGWLYRLAFVENDIHLEKWRKYGGTR